MQPWIGFVAEVVFRVQQDLEKTDEILFAKCGGALSEPLAVLFRGCDQIGIGAARARDQQVAKMLDCFAAKLLQVLTFRQKAVHYLERTLRRARLDRTHQFVENLASDYAQ